MRSTFKKIDVEKKLTNHNYLAKKDNLNACGEKETAHKKI